MRADLSASPHLAATEPRGKTRDGFLGSELTLDNRFQTLADFLRWFESRKKAHPFVVRRVPLNTLDQWRFDSRMTCFGHASGKFFAIKGLRVSLNGEEWDQPIIDQPEIGILGIITKKFDGVRYFLMQAKMEPGNINLMQLSPTVQATRSNYTRVHQGSLPKYLEYFLDGSTSRVLVDHLQTEHGRRFLRKRNRNMIVEVEKDIPVYEDFRWLTLGELKQLVRMDNFVNIDSRSVLSCINFLDEKRDTEAIDDISDGFKRDIFVSMMQSNGSLHNMNDIIHWFTDMKARTELTTTEIPLNALRDWTVTDTDIRHHADRFFTVIGVSVVAGNREVGSWMQPLIQCHSHGLIGFLVKKINGTAHVLVQAKAEPGSFTVVELVPTVECDDTEERIKRRSAPPFAEFLLNAPSDRRRFDAFQSEEGGRFYHCQNRCMIVETDEGFPIPPNYTWMTLNQIMSLIPHNYFNIDARNLLTYLRLQ
ncbi:MAG: NDP-hexose 2,3-dehydratase [Parcubacteria group bacterium Gr01-1014_38]|nr:MAG: NDP-hexose 2,3-dehydratase [Parcubacteria group bacterium Gr01-1014_38]